MSVKLQSHKKFEDEKGVKYLLHKKLAISDKPRSLDILHASELTHTERKFCPRERAFLLRDGDNRPDEFLGTALNITFQVGRWYEDQVRNVWLREFSMGTWVCSVCQTRHHYQTVPEKCSDCGDSRYLNYEEPRAYSEKYGTSCGIDMLMWRNDAIHVVEIKTMGRPQFEVLKAPLHEHYTRTQFYLDLLSESHWMNFDVKINLDFAYILYVCKGFGFGDDYEGREGIQDSKCSPFKEYIVERGDHADMLSLYDLASQVRKYRKTGVLPKQKVCVTPTCARAEKCTYVQKCWSE